MTDTPPAVTLITIHWVDSSVHAFSSYLHREDVGNTNTVGLPGRAAYRKLPRMGRRPRQSHGGDRTA